MALNLTLQSGDDARDGRANALRVYESPVSSLVTFWPRGADRSARLSRESVAALRDALTEYLGDGAPAAPTFEPGDRVRVAEDAKSTDGDEVGVDLCGVVGIVMDGPDEDGDYRVYREDGPRYDYEYVGASYLTKTEDEEPAPRFAAGDRVKLGPYPRNAVIRLAASWAGAVATVQSGPDPDGDYWVKVVGGEGHTYVAAESLTKIEAPRFAVGDRVRISARPTSHRAGPVASTFHGKLGTVVPGSPRDSRDVNVRVDGSLLVQYVGAEHLTKVEEPRSAEAPRFAVGDRVRVKEGMFAGVVGEVHEAANRWGNVVLRRERGRDLAITERDLEAAPAPAFAVGDRVRISERPTSRQFGTLVSHLFHGKLGKVTEGPTSRGDYRVSVESAGFKQYIAPESLTKVEDEPERFEPGDRVKVAEDARYMNNVERVSSTTRGKIGTIVNGPDPDGDYRVRPTGREGWEYVGREYLTKVEAEAEEPKSFERGDRVKLSDPARDCFGYTYTTHSGAVGKVERKLACGDYRVTLDGGGMAAVRPDDLTKVEEPALAEGDLVLIGDRPETENGSSVDPRYFGGVGEIVEGSFTSMDEYFVKLVHQSPTARPDGSTSWRSDGQNIAARHLTKVERLARDARPEDGTRVVVLDGTGARGRAKVGATGRVIGADPTPVDGRRLLRVRQDDGRGYQMYADRFGRLAS